MTLFHVSDAPGIARFLPRPAADGVEKVWAIEQRTLANYLLPRDCPRICLRPGVAHDPDELALLEGAAALIVIEAAWLPRVESTTLFVYEFPADSFTLEDRIAGYWTCRAPVTPLAEQPVNDLPQRIAEAGARLVTRPTLWPLRDRVLEAALDFSLIRMRNAAPRPT